MDGLTLIKPLCNDKGKSDRLDHVLRRCLPSHVHDEISTACEFENTDVRGKRLIFAVAHGASGINLEYYKILEKIRLGKSCLEGCSAGVIVDGESEFFTKGAARELVLSANMAGCSFVGKSLVEGTGTLMNLRITAKNLKAGKLEAYAVTAENLVKRVLGFEMPAKESPRILMVHAGRRKNSNSLALWDMVKKHLGACRVSEISLLDGEIKDCNGCPFASCRHFGEQKSCYYGGVITEKVYPALLESDVLIVVSPNYNDAAPAYITAFINRLTPLFRVNQLSGKMLFAIVVSGYSGGDLVAKQLIGALNMNKPFILPGKSILFETAGGPGEISRLPGIEKLAMAFSQNMLKQIKK